MKLSPTFIAAVAFVSGFNRSEVPTAVAIALAESSGESTAKNTSSGQLCAGLWQVNTVANKAIVDKYKSLGGIYSPIGNGKMAYAIYKQQGWGAWDTYKNGAYRKYLTQGQSGEAVAVKNPIKIAMGDPSKWVVNGQVPPTGTTGLIGPAPNGLDNPNTTGTSLPGVPDLSGITSALGTLTSSSTWLRIGAVIGAVILVLVGVVFMVESNKDVQSATKIAALA